MGKGNRNRTRNAIQNATDVELNQKNKAFEDFMSSPITGSPLHSVINYFISLHNTTTNSTIAIEKNHKQENNLLKSAIIKRDIKQNRTTIAKEKSKIQPIESIDSYGNYYTSRILKLELKIDEREYLSKHVINLVNKFPMHTNLLFKFYDLSYDESKINDNIKNFEDICHLKYNVCPYTIVPIMFNANMKDMSSFVLNIIRDHNTYYKNITNDLNPNFKLTENYKYNIIFNSINAEETLNKCEEKPSGIYNIYKYSIDRSRPGWELAFCENKTKEESEWLNNNFIPVSGSNFTYRNNNASEVGYIGANRANNTDALLVIGFSMFGVIAGGLCLAAMCKNFFKKKTYAAVNPNDQNQSDSINNGAPATNSFTCTEVNEDKAVTL